MFYVRFKLVKSASQIQFSKTHFLRPGSLTTTANLKQTCPNQHFPIPDQSQLTDLQPRLNTLYEKNSYRCKENNGQSMNGIYTVMVQYFLQHQLPFCDVPILQFSFSKRTAFSSRRHRHHPKNSPLSP